MLYSSLHGRGVWKKMGTCICMLSPFAVHLKLSQHYLSATLQHKIKSLQLKKKSKYFLKNLFGCTGHMGSSIFVVACWIFNCGTWDPVP